MITVPAILAALFAPVTIIIAGGVDRRTIVFSLLVLLFIANIASALAPTILWFLAARIIVGFCMGGIWAIAGGLAARLVPAPSIGLATAVIFGGVAAASVLGIPLGALIGEYAGWRATFGAMAAVSLIVLLINISSLPHLPVQSSVTVRQLCDGAMNRRVQLGLVATLLIVAGHFMAFTFVRPLLQSVSGIGPEWLSLVLLMYGIAGIAGNFLAGAVASRQVGWALVAIALSVSTSILSFNIIGSSEFGGTAMVVLWGLAYGGVSVGLQTWMIRAAPDAVEVATSLFVAAFNVAIASGAYVGGEIVDAFGLNVNMLIAGSLPAMALIVAGVIQVISAPSGPVKT
jgi:predicted MFS family arabinose efflux permease